LSNLDKIKNFFLDNENSILINPTNDKVLIFYKYILKFFAEKNGTQIYENEEIMSDDLFDLQKKVILRNTTSAKLIDHFLNSNEKFIIVTDYRNYKKFNSKVISINGYDYIKDLKIFLIEYMNYYDEKLLKIISDNIFYIESEITKFAVNPKNYQQSFFDHLIKDKIKQVRINLNKKHPDQNSLYEKYKLIKLEYIYKKLNFLTY